MISWNGVRVPVFNEDPTHAHAVDGDFYKEYLAAGGVKIVGYISEDEVTGQPDGMSGATVVAGQWFQNGGIFYKTGAGVHYLPNAWLDAITPEVEATLGYPTSGVHDVVGGTAVNFENGFIALSPDGKFTVFLKTPAPSPSASSTPTAQSGTLKALWFQARAGEPALPPNRRGKPPVRASLGPATALVHRRTRHSLVWPGASKRNYLKD
jgi:hypothetical protein